MNNLQIKTSQQTFNFLDISVIWSGINVCLPSFMLGGLLVPGLNSLEALIITLAGNSILAVLIYLMALPGLKKGYSSALMSRLFFGYPFGSTIASIFVLISMIGWSAILLELSGQAAYEICLYYNLLIPYKLIIIVIGLLIIISTQSGAKQISALNRLNVPILGILLLWIGFVILKKYNIYSLLSYTAAGDISYNRGLNLIIGGTIAGVFVSSDLNRYAVDKKSLSLGVFIGTIPITLCLAAIGILSRLATGSWNPVSIVINLGMGIPALLLVVLAVWTTTQASLYSGSLAAANIFPELGRKTATFFLGTAMIITSIFRILSSLEGWLILLDNLFSPLIAISLYKIYNAKYTETKIDWQAVMAIIIALTLKSITPETISSALLTMLYTVLTYFILEKFINPHQPHDKKPL